MIADTTSVENEIISLQEKLRRVQQAREVGRGMFAGYQQRHIERQAKICEHIDGVLWETMDLSRYLDHFLDSSLLGSKDDLLQQAYLCCAAHRCAMLMQQHELVIEQSERTIREIRTSLAKEASGIQGIECELVTQIKDTSQLWAELIDENMPLIAKQRQELDELISGRVNNDEANNWRSDGKDFLRQQEGSEHIPGVQKQPLLSVSSSLFDSLRGVMEWNL